MELEKFKAKVLDKVETTVKEVIESLEEENLPGGIVCFLDVGGTVGCPLGIRLNGKEDELQALSALLGIVANNNKTIMKAMVIAGLTAEIKYTKDEQKRKLISDKCHELAELFDS